MTKRAGDGVDRSGEGQLRICSCGFEDKTTSPECPECGQTWFADPVTGEVYGFDA